MIAYAPQDVWAFFIADGGLIRYSRSVRIPLCPTAIAKRHSRIDRESQRRAQPPGNQPSENPYRA